MSSKVLELKAQIYDQVVILQNSQRQITALEQELLAVLKKEAQEAPVSAEAPEVVPHNNT
jgi:ribosomal silencing factor RsfS